MPHLDVETILAALAGGGSVLAIAKHVITSMLKKIDAMPLHIAKINGDLSIIKVRMEMLDRLQTQTNYHAQQIAEIQKSVAVLEARRSGSNKRFESNCQA